MRHCSLVPTSSWSERHRISPSNIGRHLHLLSSWLGVVRVLIFVHIRCKQFTAKVCFIPSAIQDFSKKMHAITGFFATCLALSQPIFAFFRPSPHSKYRIFFNWLHWFVGMAAWSFASKNYSFDTLNSQELRRSNNSGCFNGQDGVEPRIWTHSELCHGRIRHLLSMLQHRPGND